MLKITLSYLLICSIINFVCGSTVWSTNRLTHPTRGSTVWSTNRPTEPTRGSTVWSTNRPTHPTGVGSFYYRKCEVVGVDFILPAGFEFIVDAGSRRNVAGRRRNDRQFGGKIKKSD